MMRKALIIPSAILLLAAAAACGGNYNTRKADEIVDNALTDTALTQTEYKHMISLLDDGYSYVRARIARAAFESDPSASVNDLINFLGDTTLHAVQSNARVLIAVLDTATLNPANERRYKAILAKYRELDLSLYADSASLSEAPTAGR